MTMRERGYKSLSIIVCALLLSLSSPSSFSSSCSCLISASSASLPACVRIGTPLCISFSKYLGTNMPSKLRDGKLIHRQTNQNLIVLAAPV
ncbi:hypothetical protein EDB89DRAFT_1962087 [Lactarius sanguifluus]|nr:hypothetical protein EDB89DRAFT_1962087 [Lactarius sanguifluus]